MADEARDTIYIGKKPLMAYVMSAKIQLASMTTVKIKARGLSIGRAVDVAQILARKKGDMGYAVSGIEIGSETLQSEDGKSRNVSTIEIRVKKSEAAAQPQTEQPQQPQTEQPQQPQTEQPQQPQTEQPQQPQTEQPQQPQTEQPQQPQTEQQ